MTVAGDAMTTEDRLSSIAESVTDSALADKRGATNPGPADKEAFESKDLAVIAESDAADAGTMENLVRAGDSIAYQMHGLTNALLDELERRLTELIGMLERHSKKLLDRFGQQSEVMLEELKRRSADLTTELEDWTKRLIDEFGTKPTDEVRPQRMALSTSEMTSVTD